MKEDGRGTSVASAGNPIGWRSKKSSVNTPQNVVKSVKTSGSDFHKKYMWNAFVVDLQLC